MADVLKKAYGLFVEFVVRNPLYVPNGDVPDVPAFHRKLDLLCEGLPNFSK